MTMGRGSPALDAGEPLTRTDWARVLIATEIAVASDYYRAGVEWSIVALPDDQTVKLLRSVQRKLVSIARLTHLHGDGPSRSSE